MSHYLCQFRPLLPQHVTIVPISGIASTFLGVYILPSRGTGLLIHGYKHLAMLAFQTKAAVFPLSYQDHLSIQLNPVLIGFLSHSPDSMFLDSPCDSQRQILRGFLPRLSCIYPSLFHCYRAMMGRLASYHSQPQPKGARHKYFLFLNFNIYV